MYCIVRMCDNIHNFGGMEWNVLVQCIQVRARGANKGNFVHMVLDRLGWPAESSTSAGDVHDDFIAAAAPAGRFCLCVGDDVSDEDMFIAVKVGGPAYLSIVCACGYSHVFCGCVSCFVVVCAYLGVVRCMCLVCIVCYRVWLWLQPFVLCYVFCVCCCMCLFRCCAVYVPCVYRVWLWLQLCVLCFVLCVLINVLCGVLFLVCCRYIGNSLNLRYALYLVQSPSR